MKTINLRLFGGRIDSAKFALNLAIKKFKDMGQPDMAIIYENMLEDIIKAEIELAKDEKELTSCDNCKYAEHVATRQPCETCLGTGGVEDNFERKGE